MAANPTTSSRLFSGSATALYRLYSYIVATVIWSLEVLFDAHKEETKNTIAQLKPHSKLWYRNQALAFQYGDGFSSPEGAGLNENTGTYASIDINARIVKFAAVEERENESENILRIKAAKDAQGTLSELSTSERAALQHYFSRIKDAGVKIRIITQQADQLRLNLDIYFDPLVLDGRGAMLDGTNNAPVAEAINNYLSNLPFNGEFSKTALTDHMQAIEGVKIPQILSAETKWGTYDWALISATVTPEAGWMRVYSAAEIETEITESETNGIVTITDGDLTIRYIPYGVAV
ncbi:MAG: nucleotidyltransferase [Bacteroidales bacterium]|nr:nucleotidyltransferase [Bacteroidales bacterium]